MSTNETDSPAATPLPQTNVVPLPNAPEEQPAHKKVASFVREHPVMTIAGGLAIGAVAAALIPSRNRKYIARQSSAWADAVTAASAALAQQALSQAESASHSVRERSHAIASRAERAGHIALGKAERARHTAIGRAQALVGRKPEPTFTEKLAASAGRLMGRMHR